MTDPKPTRIVLLGKTGAGKSSLANTIFGEKLFTVLPGFKSGTSVSETKTKSVNGRNITLIDTPGFFDTDRSEEEIKPEIMRCITECSPGPHAFLIVLKLERFTEQEEDIIHRMIEYFSEDVYKYSTVVFTHGKELPEGKTVKDLVKQNKSLSDFIEKCGGRCHVIDNNNWNNHLRWNYRNNKFQVNDILKSIDKTVEANNRQCYTNVALQITEELIQQEEKRIAETSENMSEEEIRKEAKNRVNTFLIQAAGITVGALLGALFGVVLPVVFVTAGMAGLVKTAEGTTTAVLTLGAVGTIGAAGTIGAGLTAGAGAVGAEAVAIGAAGSIGTGLTAGAVGVEAVAIGAVGTAGSIGAGLTAGAVGVLAAVGAGFGGYEGHQAAQTAETPWEAAEMASEAVCSKGLKVIKEAHNLASQLDKLSDIKVIKEKDSNI